MFLSKFGSSILLLLDNDLPSFNVLLKMIDTAGIICIAQRLTCCSINTMTSVLFDNEACYAIKKNNIEKSELQGCSSFIIVYIF